MREFLCFSGKDGAVYLDPALVVLIEAYGSSSSKDSMVGGGQATVHTKPDVLIAMVSAAAPQEAKQE